MILLDYCHNYHRDMSQLQIFTNENESSDLVGKLTSRTKNAVDNANLSTLQDNIRGRVFNKKGK